MARPISFRNFIFLVGFTWFLLLVFMFNSSDDKTKRGSGDANKIKKEELAHKEMEPIFDDFEDDFAENTERQKAKKVKIKNQISTVNGDIENHDLDPPPLSQEILDLHKQLNLTNPGHMGQPVILPSQLSLEFQEKINKSWEIYSFNEFVSTLIPLYRELPDIRPDECRQINYSENLPVTSVIMIFHNEPFTLIMRSVFAVFKRTPEHLLGEIVLVDDCSDQEPLKKPLDEFIANYPKIKLVRSPLRVGLIKARMIGCVNAEGPALVFMDAHVEVTRGWLQPLIDPLAKNPNASTVPVVDGLDGHTLQYKYNPNPKTYMVGGFDWNMIYKWKNIPDWEKKRLKNPWDPIRSPTMLGAFFVIMKDYFELLGMYDPYFEIWGAENLELSFKVWMCGGELYQIPCSHGAHLFRSKHPYTYPKGGHEVKINTDRLAEVWLGDYKRFYYRATNFNKREFGDVTEQKQLRDKLGCKDFKWFLENVYQDVEYPDRVKDPPPANAQLPENVTERTSSIK